MKCPKCGYNSFDHLENCKKCETSLTDHKEKFNLRGFFSPGQSAATAPVADSAEDQAPEDDGSVDFGFDFLEEDGDAAKSPGGENVSIDQPFGADSESVPADDKSEKGSEFAF